MTIEETPRCPIGSYLPTTGSLDTNPFDVIEEVGSRAPFWVEDPADAPGYWVVTKYADAREALQDHERFSAVGVSIPWAELAEPMLPSFADPPEVQKYRRSLVRAMSPTALEGLKPRMEEICADLISKFVDRGHCEAVGEFASLFPITVFLGFFGMPAEQCDEFIYWAHKWLHDRTNQREYWAHIQQIVSAQVDAKVGQPPEDLLGIIANDTIDGEPITRSIAVNIASTVFIGGLETVPTVITWSLRHLALNPDVRATLVADLSETDTAVEELLRMYPVGLPKRRVTRDFDFHGADMRTRRSSPTRTTLTLIGRTTGI
jgi:cytochrome P450